jgi:hypothetical protein
MKERVMFTRLLPCEVSDHGWMMEGFTCMRREFE